MVWLRRYPTFYHLAMHFSIPVAVVHRTLLKIVPYLHTVVVPKYIKWHSDAEWISLAGTFSEWPRVVGIIF